MNKRSAPPIAAMAAILLPRWSFIGTLSDYGKGREERLRSAPPGEQALEEALDRRRKAGAVVDVAELAQRFGLRRVRMDGGGEAAEADAVVHRQHGLADHLAGVTGDDGEADQLVGALADD